MAEAIILETKKPKKEIEVISVERVTAHDYRRTE